MNKGRYKLKDKRDRNRRLIEFKEKHPAFTHEAISKIFHMDRSRVSRILEDAPKWKEEPVGQV